MLTIIVIGLVYAYLPPELQAGASGRVTIHDGDTLTLGNEKFRLFAIDAPEYKQPCYSAKGEQWQCSERATEYLRELVAGKTVTCQRVDHDKYGRTVGICFANGEDVNAAMVHGGMAVAYYRYSYRYSVNEIQARDEKRGIWQGKFMKPEDWRKTNY